MHTTPGLPSSLLHISHRDMPFDKGNQHGRQNSSAASVHVYPGASGASEHPAQRARLEAEEVDHRQDEGLSASTSPALLCLWAPFASWVTFVSELPLLLAPLVSESKLPLDSPCVWAPLGSGLPLSLVFPCLLIPLVSVLPYSPVSLSLGSLVSGFPLPRGSPCLMISD